MAITVDKLINDDRFCGENVFQFLLYLPFGIILLLLRTVLALFLWIASILLPNSPAVRQILSTLACITFGVYVKLKGKRDKNCNVIVANCVSCLDSLAVSHVLGTISLKKWKVPPFFASTLGIRNAAQFVRKPLPEEPLLLQPEGAPTNGRGVLQFRDWPVPLPLRAQPATIVVERALTAVTVHRWWDARGRFPWSDALWFLWTPATIYRITLLPAMEAPSSGDLANQLREAIATNLGVELVESSWEDLNRACLMTEGLVARAVPAPVRRAPPPELTRLANQVKDVLPAVPLADIMRDLATTRSVDVTITNFLEGITPYRAETATPAFPPSARQRQLGFQERKAQMIAEARQRYIDKHGLNLALNC